ncbi:MAG TPA: class I tRNA ligase family protein, partial [Cyclobacteriaceae bacterium]
DAVRTGMLFSAPAGNDLLYDDKLVEQGRNFANKIWNAFRLVKGWSIDGSLSVPQENKVAIEWFESKLNQSLAEIEDHFSKFRISDALHSVYKLIWDDFCSWYLEMIKPEFGKPIDEATYNKTINFFETILKVSHPFMPFITEELWHELNERSERDCILVASWPKAGASTAAILEEAAFSFEVITEVRNTRNAKGLSPKEALKLLVKGDEGKSPVKSFWPIIKKLSNLSEVSFVSEQPAGATAFITRSTEFYIPLVGKVDTEKERETILKDLEYQRGFIISVNKKLENEKFVNSAPPQVVEIERKKKADAEAKIKSLEENLSRL